MTEKDYETLLNIETGGTDKYHTSHLYHRYEPTPYEVLHHLFEHYEIKPSDSRGRLWLWERTSKLLYLSLLSRSCNRH